MENMTNAILIKPYQPIVTPNYQLLTHIYSGNLYKDISYVCYFTVKDIGKCNTIC